MEEERLREGMVSSEMKSSGESAFLGVDELRVVIGSLAPPDVVRLERSARYLGWRCRTEGRELLGEAVLRALVGRRRCPRNVFVVVFLTGVMRSLASEIIAKRRIDPLSARLGEDARSPSGSLASSPSSDPDPETALAIKRNEGEIVALVAEIEALFADDPRAKMVLQGELNGLTAEEIRARGAMDRTAYGTVRRRIRRRIDKAYPNGWNR